MSGRRSQLGAVGALVIAIMVIILLGIMATYVLSRIATGSDEVVVTQKRLATAAEALDAFAGSSSRLPCPANPALDDGLEARNPPAACQFPEGTLPWRTIGLKREDAYDTWGRKLSYRVYTGNRGSLVQEEGASMVYCDTTPAGTGTEAVTGLCKGRPSVGGVAADRNTAPEDFLDNKGMSLTDHATAYNSSVAYVLISHGATGFGGYTISGARLDLPLGDERNNIRENGPFTIKAFSDVDVAATSGQHFDDILAFRTVSELVRRANLVARDWPDGAPPVAAAALGITFNQATVSTGAGTSVSPGAGVGTGSLTLPGAQVSGRDSGSTPSEISYGENAGYGGIGVAGGGDVRVQSSANELVRVVFDESFSKFAVTLNDFGFYFDPDNFYVELVEFRFFLSDVQVGSSLFGISCGFDGLLASFSMDVGAQFNRVDIVPLPAFNFFGDPGITAFYVSDLKVCPSADATCRTTLDDPANTQNTRCS